MHGLVELVAHHLDGIIRDALGVQRMQLMHRTGSLVIFGILTMQGGPYYG